VVDFLHIVVVNRREQIGANAVCPLGSRRELRMPDPMSGEQNGLAEACVAESACNQLCEGGGTWNTTTDWSTDSVPGGADNVDRRQLFGRKHPK
jgi:hypothetical protein